MGVQAAAAAPPVPSENDPAVSRAWAQVAPHLRGLVPRTVLVRVTDSYAWPVQAGLMLELEEHGWHSHVQEPWVFMFGPSRRETGREAVVITLRAVTATGPAEQLAADVSIPAPIKA